MEIPFRREMSSLSLNLQKRGDFAVYIFRQENAARFRDMKTPRVVETRGATE